MATGNILKFEPKERRRIIDVLKQMTDAELIANESLLRSGYIMQYHRFGPPSIQVKPSDIDLVLLEIGRRGMGQPVKREPDELELMYPNSGLIVSDAFIGKLNLPLPPKFSISIRTGNGRDSWNNWPMKEGWKIPTVREVIDPLVPKYKPLSLEDSNAPKERQSPEVWPEDW